MGMLFGKASRRTPKRFGTILRGRNRNSLKVKSFDTHPFLIKSPSEALERSIPVAAFCNKRVNALFLNHILLEIDFLELDPLKRRSPGIGSCRIDANLGDKPTLDHGIEDVPLLIL